MDGAHPVPDNAIPFAFFASLIQAIAAIKPRKVNQKTTRTDNDVPHVVQIFRNWVAELHRRYAPFPPNTTAVVFRLLFPEEDVRRKYGLQENRLAEYVSNILGISSHPGSRGYVLKDWKGESSVGCLGIDIQVVLQESSTVTESRLSIVEVDALLTELASTCAFSASVIRPPSASPDESRTHRSKSVILRSLYATLSPIEACIITQIILKDLRPVLYPIPSDETHYTTLLLRYNSNALTQLTKEAAMREWDPDGRMLATYHTRAYLDEASLVYESMSMTEEIEVAFKPQVGVPVQIPKCVKGQGCAHALQALRGSQKVWAETKYDGERAQIHVEINRSEPRITIFSKSGRDSTFDRYATHSVITSALGLGSASCGIQTNIIIEAEMVAFSDVLGRIDEFWRIRSLIGSTAIGPRHAQAPPVVVPQEDTEDFNSQCSLISDASDGGTRHLALVFFDILMLNDQSFLSSAYSMRRDVLESIINIIPGHVMLAEREPISFAQSRRGWEDSGDAQLRGIFSRLIADHQEGVVLKADEGHYSQRRFPWVKLKKDYIKGYGDTVDLVLIGAAWDKERARELRVAPTVYTTFYLGALKNDETLRNDPRCLPHFEVFCYSSYGLDRKELEELNFIVKSSDPVEFVPGRPIHGLSYTCNLFQGLAPPDVLLRRLILAEVYGGGFTKAERCQFYAPRFPRIAKIFRTSERSWIEGTSLENLQEIAREAVGRDRPNKDVEDFCDKLFGRATSPGVKCPERRKRTEELWVEKLEIVDRRENEKNAKRLKTGQDSYSDYPRTTHKAKKGEKSRHTSVDSSKPHKGLRALGSVTNLARTSIEVAQSESARQDLSPVPPFSNSHSNRTRNSWLHESRNRTNEADSNFHPTPELARIAIMIRSTDSSCKATQLESSPVINVALTAAKNPANSTVSHSVIGTGSTTNSGIYTSTPMGKFLRNAAVWFQQPSSSSRPSWRVPSQTIIPTGHRVHGLESFLRTCEWRTSTAAITGCDWAERGVIFVDDSNSNRWLDHPLKTLMERRSSLVGETRPAKCKPIWVFSMKMLSYEELQAVSSDVEGRAICKLG